jgi:tetratricopeptide (TPR) repeat protein
LVGPLLFLVALELAAPPTAEFNRGKAAYERAEYSRAIEVLRPLLYPELRLETEGQVVEAHRMLGISHLFEKQNELAAQEFRKLLQMRPDYRFDALLDPPQVVDFFNGVLREYEGELAQIEQRRKQADLEERQRREAYERAKNGPTVVERHMIRNSFTVNFIPFGAGQFQNGQNKKGYAFLISESALGAISVGAFATNFAVYGFRPKTPCRAQTRGPCRPDYTDQHRSELLTRVQLVSGGLFFAVAAWGIADAILNFQPEVPAPTEIRLSAPAPATKVSLAPILDDQTLGAGLSFRF